MDTIIIKWETDSESPCEKIYYVNDSQIGVGNEGFNKILEIIRANENIQVVLKITHVTSLGGDSLIGILPFKDRFNELIEALGANRLIVDFF